MGNLKWGKFYPVWDKFYSFHGSCEFGVIIGSKMKRSKDYPTLGPQFFKMAASIRSAKISALAVLKFRELLSDIFFIKYGCCMNWSFLGSTKVRRTTLILVFEVYFPVVISTQFNKHNTL